ncbi:exonuclease domain-containing protein [Apibacter raozihei]|uniref:exonuclease domain-containing protein n=1 Tax=Apibacter TaxID=1778601 RepID=UPI000FE36B97|nr:MULTISPECIES: exonuclease domain-containing protein [Apibacter]
MDYAILDVETTGGKFNEEGIIEIAVYRFDGEKITDTFISLVNPEKEIHFYVQKLTGITNKMVRTAPKFYELAKRLVEITDETIIVAHNVAFDYRVIRTEFSRLGFNFQRPTLDTISLSRTLIPDMSSYSLGNLCTAVGIPLSDRHRAHGDARATVKLFQLLLAKDLQKNIIQSSIKQIRHQSLNKKILYLLEELPLETGVFYLQDENGKIIYIDQSTNIANKARQILTGKNKKSIELQIKTESITYELTGDEIIAKIKAQNEIKVNVPEFKPKRETNSSIYGLYFEFNQWVINPLNSKNKKYAWLSFSSAEKGISFINKTIEKLKGKEEDSDLINQHILDYFSLDEPNIILYGKGRALGENSFIYLENGVVKGYGFYNLHSQIKNLSRVKKIMTSALSSRDILMKIRNKLFITEGFKKILLAE